MNMLNIIKKYWLTIIGQDALLILLDTPKHLCSALTISSVRSISIDLSFGRVVDTEFWNAAFGFYLLEELLIQNLGAHHFNLLEEYLIKNLGTQHLGFIFWKSC